MGDSYLSEIIEKSHMVSGKLILSNFINILVEKGRSHFLMKGSKRKGELKKSKEEEKKQFENLQEENESIREELKNLMREVD